MVSAIIDKPVMRPKLLNRPPYRYLKDIIFNIMKETGLAKGEFTEEQIERYQRRGQEWSVTKGERLAVLNNAFQLVNKTFGVELDISALKVLAGKECEKTRVFLQYFCIAAQQERVCVLSCQSNIAFVHKHHIHHLTVKDTQTPNWYGNFCNCHDLVK